MKRHNSALANAAQDAGVEESKNMRSIEDLNRYMGK